MWGCRPSNSSSLLSSAPELYVHWNQGRTPDAIFQIEKGLDEAFAVNEAAISGRLRRLRAQVPV